MYLGNKLTELEFDDIGCVITEDLTDRVVNNALLIGDSEVVIVKKDNYYGGVSTRGDLLIPTMFDYMCSITSGGEVEYRIIFNDVDYLAMDYIKLAKEQFGYIEPENPNDGNSGDGQGDENQNPENEAVKTFNAQFDAYNGERSLGTTKSLIDIVNSSNTLSEQKVAIEYEGNLYTDDVSVLKDLLTNNSYTVSIEYNNESGYVDKIIIK